MKCYRCHNQLSKLISAIMMAQMPYAIHSMGNADDVGLCTSCLLAFKGFMDGEELVDEENVLIELAGGIDAFNELLDIEATHIDDCSDDSQIDEDKDL